MSFKLSYAKTFDEYNSAITFAGYRFHSVTSAPSRSSSTSSMKITTAPATKKRCTPSPVTRPFADDPQLATTLYLTYTHQNYWDRGSPGSLRDVDGAQLFVLQAFRGSALTLPLTALSIRANGTTAFRCPFRCHGAMAAQWIMKCKTAAARPVRWFRIPITATVTIHGDCAQGFR